MFEDKKVTDEEGIVYQARLHWIIFAWPIIFFTGAVYLGLNFPVALQPSMLFGGLVLLWGLATWITYHYSSLTIKTNQLVIRSGFLVRQTLGIPLNKIESVDIKQSIMGTLLGYGSLELTGTGGTHEFVNYISKPLTCRRYIEQSMHA